MVLMKIRRVPSHLNSSQLHDPIMGALRTPRLARVLCRVLLVAIATACISTAVANGSTEYYRHVIFDNSLNSDYYFYSWGQASQPSTLEQKNWRLPVESKTFLTPPNAIRIAWQSETGGGWEAEVRVMNFRYRSPEMSGRNLYLWCFTSEPISAEDLPLIVLSNTYGGLQVAEFPGSFTAP